RNVEELVGGELRRLAGAQVGEDDAGRFVAWIGPLADTLVEAAAGRFAGLLEAAPTDVVEPAVIEAAEPAILDSSVAQVGAAMRAVQTEQAGPPGLITKEGEFLAEDLQR